MVNAPSMWEKTRGGGRVVALIDTGCDVNHPEIAERIVNPRNMINAAAVTDVTDMTGHGTHVAGIIAGKNVGIAPEARIMPFKVEVNNGTLDIMAIQDAFREIMMWNKNCNVADRIVAVNCSFGSSACDQMMAYFIRMLTADGVVVCVAAGNSGDGNPDTHEVFSYPAFLAEVVTVSSIDQNVNIAHYSNSFDGIDLAAPGTDIYSTWPGGTYHSISGTSMAAPHVTGACALLADWFYQREGRYPKENEMDAAVAHFAQAEGILFKHIRPASGGSSYLFGRGILDLTFAYNRWRLNRVQVGAYYNSSGAEVVVNKLKTAGFSAYRVKY